MLNGDEDNMTRQESFVDKTQTMQAVQMAHRRGLRESRSPTATGTWLEDVEAAIHAADKPASSASVPAHTSPATDEVLRRKKGTDKTSFD